MRSEEEKGVLTSGLRRLLVVIDPRYYTIARQFVISIRGLLDRSIDGDSHAAPVTDHASAINRNRVFRHR